MTAATKAIIILTAIVVVESVILYNCLEARIYMKKELEEARYQKDIQAAQLGIFHDVWKDNYQKSMTEGRLRGQAAEYEAFLHKYHEKLSARESVTMDKDARHRFVSPDGRTKQEKVEEAYKMYREGHTLEEISKELALSLTSTKQYISMGRSYFEHHTEWVSNPDKADIYHPIFGARPSDYEDPA